MKNHSQDSMFAFVLVTIAVPTVLVGVLTVSAASELSPVTKSTYHQLFNVRSFRLRQRELHLDAVPVPAADADMSHPAAIDLKPCDPAGSVVEKTKTQSPRPLIFEDLDRLQRETLRMQLRIGGCPQDALPAYKQLCESMLKQQKSPETKTGLRHPEQ